MDVAVSYHRIVGDMPGGATFTDLLAATTSDDEHAPTIL